jgi:hypothetical protein
MPGLAEIGLGTTWPGNTLFDLKWVQTNDPSTEDTPGMVACRRMMKEKPADYLTLLSKLEAEYWEKEKLLNPQGTGPAALTEKDELMEGLLAEEWKKVKKVVHDP